MAREITPNKIARLIYNYRRMGYGMSWHVIKDLLALVKVKP
jgi:hypothetical protein